MTNEQQLSLIRIHDQSLTTLLDLSALIVSILQCHVCLNRVRSQRMPEISLQEQVRLEHEIDTSQRIEHTGSDIIVVAFKIKVHNGHKIEVVACEIIEHCRVAHGILRLQDPRLELIRTSISEHIVFHQSC